VATLPSRKNIDGGATLNKLSPMGTDKEWKDLACSMSKFNLSIAKMMAWLNESPKPRQTGEGFSSAGRSPPQPEQQVRMCKAS